MRVWDERHGRLGRKETTEGACKRSAKGRKARKTDESSEAEMRKQRSRDAKERRQGSGEMSGWKKRRR